MKYLMRCLLMFCVALSLNACEGPSGQAQDAPVAKPSEAQSQVFGDYTVHYHALRSDALSPEVAKQYRIQRSKQSAMLNVVVNQKDDAGNMQSAPATLSVKAHNLTGQVKSVELKQVQDQQATYHIATVPVSHRETLIFDITVRPNAAPQTPLSVQFQQQFFAD